MDANQTFYLGFLRFASEAMINSFRAECFITWVSEYVVGKLNSSHIAVALYDEEKDSFTVKVSAGKRRLPPNLISIKKGSPFVEWFHDRVKSDPNLKFCHMVTSEDVRQDANPLSGALFQEMKRHRAEVCARIQTHDRLAAYLLIGSPENQERYSSQELLFFETLATDIAIEIEKEKYYKMSHYDALTDLLNRGSLGMKFKEMLDKKTDFAVALLDLDHFKEINDQYGHLAGDEVLKITAEIIQRNIRKCDMAFRYGGEEFLILLEKNYRNPTDEILSSRDFREDISTAMERLRNAICERPFRCTDDSVPVTISIGVSFSINGEPSGQDGLIREADAALYASKRNGRNRVTLAPESDTNPIQRSA